MSSPALRRFLPVTLTTPLLGSALGIDGGAIFQIFASENLGLGPATIGLAFGLGVLSLPLQLWAARMPLWRARRNLQLFMAIAALQAVGLAILVSRGEAGGLVVVVVALAVSAEVFLSVLYATSWQPLLSRSLGSEDRQRLNARGRAIGGFVLVVALLVFASLGADGRVVFLVLVGLVAVCCAIGLRHVDVPVRPVVVADPSVARMEPTPISPGVRSIFRVLIVVNLGAWPLTVLYVHEVLWPAVNLGLIGALQIAGSLLASLLWRPTAGTVVGRARAAAMVMLASGAVLASLPAPLTGVGEQTALLVAVFTAAAGTTAVRVAMLELAHRSVDEASSVRAFTMLDVVGSTSLQVGLLFGGVLVALSTDRPDWFVDPYRLYVMAFAVAGASAIARLHVDESACR